MVSVAYFTIQIKLFFNDVTTSAIFTIVLSKVPSVKLILRTLSYFNHFFINNVGLIRNTLGQLVFYLFNTTKYFLREIH